MSCFCVRWGVFGFEDAERTVFRDPWMIPRMYDRMPQMVSFLCFADPLDNQMVFLHHVGVACWAVRERALGTAFDPVWQILIITSALPAQQIKRAIAEQAIKVIRVDPLVTGEVLTGPVLKKLRCVLLHGEPPVSGSRLCAGEAAYARVLLCRRK